uniref:POU domain protein n=1 Tax=Callorhinchus milii TaxID=7868 RepID=A0A4W3JJ71_CALMI
QGNIFGGVGSLSQSTICRFESLTLSHNNMIALKPVLQTWLEEAESAYREKVNKPEMFNSNERKRKRTSIAAPEKRSLEAYFAIQPRPSSEKIAAIAEKLDLKKNVVRVWFCNQRQKQKRMKYSPLEPFESTPVNFLSLSLSLFPQFSTNVHSERGREGEREREREREVGGLWCTLGAVELCSRSWIITLHREQNAPFFFSFCVVCCLFAPFQFAILSLPLSLSLSPSLLLSLHCKVS